MKGLHCAPFGERDTHFTGSTTPPGRRLSQGADLFQRAFKLRPEGLRFCGCHFVKRAWAGRPRFSRVMRLF
jgi:hypothetical protein